jgi:chromate transporter
MRWGGVPGMRGAFYGIAAAVIALIARSVVKLARLTLARDVLLWSLAVTSALVTAWTESELAWLFVLSGAIALTVRIAQRRAPSTAALGLAWPLALVTGLHGPAAGGTLSRIAFYFTEAGAFVFGSGLAIVPFLHGGVVQRFGWLDDGQFLDAVAVAMVTPGPVVITVAFIGYLVAGFAGACVAALATFAPCYLFTVLPAPYFRRFGHDLRVRAFVDGVTAAATGAIAGAAFVLGRRALLDPPAVLLCLATLALLRYTKTPEAVAILAAGLFGVIWKGL